MNPDTRFGGAYNFSPEFLKQNPAPPGYTNKWVGVDPFAAERQGKEYWKEYLDKAKEKQPPEIVSSESIVDGIQGVNARQGAMQNLGKGFQQQTFFGKNPFDTFQTQNFIQGMLSQAQGVNPYSTVKGSSATPELQAKLQEVLAQIQSLSQQQ